MEPYTPARTERATPVERTTLNYGLLIRALYGALGQHRDGYVTVDGLQAEPVVAFAGSTLIAEKLIGLYYDDQGNRAAHLTMEGLDVPRTWDLAVLDGGAP